MLKFKQILNVRHIFCCLSNQAHFTQIPMHAIKKGYSSLFSAHAQSQTEVSSSFLKSEKDQIVSKTLSKSLEIMEKAKAFDEFLCQRILMEFKNIPSFNDHVLDQKANALKLIEISNKFRDSYGLIHIKKLHSFEEEDSFEVLSEPIQSFQSIQYEWDEVLLNSNFAIQDLELLFETIFRIPRIWSRSPEMIVYLKDYLCKFHNEIPISLALFFMNKIVVKENAKGISYEMLNSLLRRYSQVKENLFDLGTMAFVYYGCLYKTYIHQNNAKAWKKGGHLSSAFESHFVKTQNIDISFLLSAEDQQFYTIILSDAFDYIDRFEKGEVDISPKFFIQSLLFFFTSFSRSHIRSQELCKRLETLAVKYQEHLSLADKFSLLFYYCNFLNIVPQFVSLFEEEIFKGIRLFSFNLKHGSSIVLHKSKIDTLNSKPAYYLHLKKCLDPKINTDNQLLLEGNKSFPISMEQIYEIYWYLAKTNTGQKSVKSIQLTNNLINLFMNVSSVQKICGAIHSACLLSLTTNEDITNWKEDIQLKSNMFLKKIRKFEIDDLLNLQLSQMAYFYKDLVFIKFKFGIDLFKDIPKELIEGFKNERLRALHASFLQSNNEDRIFSIISNYLKKNRINRGIYQNKIVDLERVDILIEPNIVVEINGGTHFSMDNSYQAINPKFLPSHLMKTFILESMGYKVVDINYYQYTSFYHEKEELESFVLKQIKKVLKL